MNKIEEVLWNYIDGNCTAAEREQISHLIKTDEVFKKHYQQLLELEQGLKTIELDEPSMAFTYKVMEHIRTQEAKVPLKAAVNKNIIRGIGAFFLLSIIVLLMYTLGNINWSIPQPASNSLYNNISDFGKYLSGPVITTFMFFDVIMLLFLTDNYLRRHHINKAGQIN